MDGQGTATSKFLSNKDAKPAKLIPQVDGTHDDYDDVINTLLMGYISIYALSFSFYLCLVGLFF